MARKTSLSAVTALLNTAEYKALLVDTSVKADFETADLRGLTDRYEINQALLASNTFDFQAYLFKTGSTVIKNTALDVTVWSIGGTDYIADVESGQIQIGVPVEDGQGINVFDKVPNVVGGQSMQITTKKMISVSTNLADITKLAFTGTIAQLSVAVDIVCDSLHYTAPCLLKGSVHSIANGKIQLEDVTLILQGPPTAPLTGTGLIGKCLLGDSTCTIDFNTGANEYIATGANADPAAKTCIITRIGIDFGRGQATKLSGTLAMQGAPVVS